MHMQVNGEDVAPTKEAIMKAAGAAMKKGEPRILLPPPMPALPCRPRHPAELMTTFQPSSPPLIPTHPLTISQAS